MQGSIERVILVIVGTVYLRFKNLIATVLHMANFIVCELGRGPFTIPRCTSPKHPSPSISSRMILLAGISHLSMGSWWRSGVLPSHTILLPFEADIMEACTQF